MGRRIEEGDDADTHHYAAACYASVFVCRDSRLAEIIALIPDPGARPIALVDFASRHLAATGSGH